MTDEALTLIKNFLRNRLTGNIENYNRCIDTLDEKERKIADEAVAEARARLDDLEKVESLEELKIKFKLDTNPSDVKPEEIDMKFDDILVAYEDLKKMEEKDIMVARTLMSIKYNSGVIKNAYGDHTPTSDIDYVEEHLKTLDYITYERPTPRFLILKNKNTEALKGKEFLDDIAHCFADIYYGQLEKIREKKGEVVVHLSSFFNINIYIKSKGYNVVELGTPNFDVIV